VSREVLGTGTSKGVFTPSLGLIERALALGVWDGDRGSPMKVQGIPLMLAVDDDDDDGGTGVVSPMHASLSCVNNLGNKQAGRLAVDRSDAID